MIKIRRYSAKDAMSWDAFVDASKNGTFLLKREYMDYHSDRYKDHSLLFYNDEELIALLPASEHGSELRSHGGLTYGGVICTQTMKQHKMNDCIEALLSYMQDNKLERIIYKAIPYIYHRYPCQEDLYALWKYNARLVRRDVASVMEFSNFSIKMSKGRKAQIARARREGISISQSIDFDAFLTLENQVLTKYHNAKATHTAAELDLLYSRFPNNIRLYVATHERKIEAGVLLFIFDNMVHTQYMASSDFGRENGALDLIISTIIDEYKGQKSYLDFGTSMEDAGRILNNGLISQKEGFGARSIIYDFYELRA